MKKNIFKVLAYSFVAATALTFGSCSSDDHYDVTGNPDNLVYFRAGSANSNEFTATVKHTPVGDFSDLKIKLPVYLQRSVAAGTTVTVALDNTAVETYNAEKSTSYATLPEAVVQIVKNTVVFKADTLASTDSVEVQLQEAALAQLTESAYLMPLRIINVSGGASGSEERGIIYVKISNVNDYIHVNSNDVVTGSIAHTPVGSFGGITLDHAALVSNAAKVGATATIAIDNSLVAEYNAANSTNYKEIPSGALTIENATVTIAEGATASSTNFKASIPEDKLATLTEPAYVVPLRISAQRTDGVSVADAGVIYLIVTTSEKLINEGAGSDLLKGAEISTEDMLTWTCDNANMSDVCDNGDWTTMWSDGTYVIDMQSEKAITGFKFLPGYYNYSPTVVMSVALSSDGATWTDCGSTESMADEGGWRYFVLYGGVPARYIKLTYTTDIWGWYHFGLDAIRVYAE